MSDDAVSSPDFHQFLAYFVECDEHLDASRRRLLDLEGSIGTHEPDRQLLDELFRSFHSDQKACRPWLASAGRSPAHHLESYLGELRKGHSAPLRRRTGDNDRRRQIAGSNTGRASPKSPVPDSEPVLADLQAILREFSDAKPGSQDSSSREPEPTRNFGRSQSEVAAR